MRLSLSLFFLFFFHFSVSADEAERENHNRSLWDLITDMKWSSRVGWVHAGKVPAKEGVCQLVSLLAVHCVFFFCFFYLCALAKTRSDPTMKCLISNEF